MLTGSSDVQESGRDITVLSGPRHATISGFSVHADVCILLITARGWASAAMLAASRWVLSGCNRALCKHFTPDLTSVT